MVHTLMTVAQAAGSATARAGVAAPAPAGGDFPPFDPQYWAPQVIWLAVIFGVLYWAMSRLALPRVSGILEARRQRIASDLESAEAARRDAEQAGATYERLLGEARARAQATAQETHAKLAAEREAHRKALEERLNAKLAAAEAQIVETKKRALIHVSTIAHDAAASIVERLLGRPVSPDAISAAISQQTPR